MFETARAIAPAFAGLREVKAVVMGGSVAADCADDHSDLDLYVYSKVPIPLASRTKIVEARASYAELDNQFWETEDYWFEKPGLKVEVIYRNCTWIENHLRDLLEHYQAQLGYSTSLWHNVLNSRVIVERGTWFSDLQDSVTIPYPEALSMAIIRKNLPLLKGSMAAYPYGLKTALERGDLILVQQRLGAIFASYFDILFALNKQPHPGEKRLLTYAQSLRFKPASMAQNLQELHDARLSPDLAAKVEALIEALLDFLELEGFVSQTL